ncbi:MAG: hypothetical protein ACKVVT_16880 [Dehalococcoidia bacterium]
MPSLGAAPRLRGLRNLGALALIGAVGFFGAQWAFDGGAARADLGPDPQMPGPEVTPEVGSRPDYSKPYWFVPYQNAENQKPRYDQTVNGIPIGPTVLQPEQQPCLAEGEARIASTDDNRSSVGLKPSFLPKGAVLEESLASACGATVIAVSNRYFVPPEHESEHKLRNGKAWGDVKHGAAFTIVRESKPFAALQSSLPSERWHAVTIAGRPAAVAGPMLAEGLGEAHLVIWDDGIQTTLEAIMLTEAQLVKIAEGLYR